MLSNFVCWVCYIYLVLRESPKRLKETFFCIDFLLYNHNFPKSSSINRYLTKWLNRSLAMDLNTSKSKIVCHLKLYENSQSILFGGLISQWVGQLVCGLVGQLISWWMGYCFGGFVYWFVEGRSVGGSGHQWIHPLIDCLLSGWVIGSRGGSVSWLLGLWASG